MPPITKKWMCPNHAERLLPPKRRIPKNNATPIEVTKPRQWNNGNIEIVQSEPPATVMKPRVQVDEVLINGRRYRVPEKIVVLDFWGKLNKHKYELEEDRDVDMASGLSSPLTSLSSLDGNEDSMETDSSLDAMQAAQLLVNFSSKVRVPGSAKPAQESRVRLTNGGAKGPTKSSSTVITIKTPSPKKVSTSKVVLSAPATAAPIPTRPSRTAKKAASIKISTAIDAQTLASTSQSVNTSVTEEAPRQKRAYRKKTDKKAPSLATRELRSRSRNTTQDSISSVTFETQSGSTSRLADDGQQAGSSTSAPTTGGKTKLKPVVVKNEEEELPLSFSVPASDPTTNSAPATQAAPRRRQSRRSLKTTEEASKVEEKETKGKRGKKRKEREDEVVAEPEASNEGAPVTVSGKRSRKEKGDKGDDATGVTVGKKKPKTPNASSAASTSTAVETTPDSSSARVVLAASTPRIPPPTTPSLKIRLPRIGSAVKPTVTTAVNGNADTATRL